VNMNEQIKSKDSNIQTQTSQVILTGILGGMIGPELVRLIGVESRFAMGLAVGLASHGIGTARILEDDHSFKDKIGGAMSGIVMTLNGILASFLIPFLIRLFP
jgi:putative effector of murein hydrolase